jgi:hypothetical protein
VVKSIPLHISWHGSGTSMKSGGVKHYFIDHFNIYTREAGAGNLSLGIEGPSNAKIILEQRPNGFLGVSYKVSKAGKIKVFFSSYFTLEVPVPSFESKSPCVSKCLYLALKVRAHVYVYQSACT